MLRKGLRDPLDWRVFDRQNEPFMRALFLPFMGSGNNGGKRLQESPQTL